MKGRAVAAWLLVLLVLCTLPLCAAPPEVLPPKDPFFAAALSWFVPGLGQIYADEPLKGALFWVADTLLFWGTILTIADIDLGLNSDVGFSFAIKFRNNPSSGRIAAAIGLGTAYLAFHIFNMVDAANGAIRYNDRIYRMRFRDDGISLHAWPEFSGLSWSWGF